MKDTHSSVMLALLVVSIIAVPQASQTITEDINSTDLNDLESISDSTEDPVSIVSSQDSQSYNQTVTSADEQTKIRRNHNRSVTVYETSELRIEMIEEPGLEKKVIESEEGVLVDKKGSESDSVRVEGPEGVLVERTVNGEIETEFEGVDLDALKDRRDSLRETMEENIGEVSIESSEDSNILDVYVQPDTSVENGEYVRLRNTGGESINLEGWRVEDSTETSYTFTETDLEPEEIIRVYTDNPDAEFNWDRGLPVWAMSGDTATVYNMEGEIVKEHSYD